jgi:uncharacterized protein involved in copper resistance
MKRSTKAVGVVLGASLIALVGCEKEKPVTQPASGSQASDHGHAHGPGGEHLDQPKAAAPAAQPSDHGHAHGPGGEHLDQPTPAAGDHGAATNLGSTTIGPFNVTASRTAGTLVAGKEVVVDVIVTPAAGATAKATAVRYWIGVESGQGSVKARGDVEDPARPNRWHSHAELPSPIPPGSKLWIEIDDDQGVTSVGSLELLT